MSSRPIRVVSAKFPIGIDVCDPHDSTWFWWWAPVLSPLPVLVLAFVHHLAVAGHSFEIDGIARALGIDPAHLVGSVRALEKHRLMRLSASATVDVFSPIPRPSLEALAAMKEEE